MQFKHRQKLKSLSFISTISGFLIFITYSSYLATNSQNKSSSSQDLNFSQLQNQANPLCSQEQLDFRLNNEIEKSIKAWQYFKQSANSEQLSLVSFKNNDSTDDFRPNCQNLANSANHLVKAVVANTNNIDKAIADLDQLLLSAKETIIFDSKPVPSPQIHPRAKLARVPIIMYHDILPQKEVFFDVTPQELEADFALIKSKGITPISLAELTNHLQTGSPLPEKPVLLTFDDGYVGHYQYVYPLLQKYGYPAVFSVYTNKLDLNIGRPGISWQQLKDMAMNPLVTIAAHSVSHPQDLRTLSDPELYEEIITAKKLLEKQLGIAINYFTYPEGKSDPRVQQIVAKAGYRAALSMNDLDEHFAGQSENLFVLGRFGQSSLEQVIEPAWGGSALPRIQGLDDGSNFTSRIYKHEHLVADIALTLIVGGRPATIHADSRYQVAEILETTAAIAAVDGAFFSLKYLDSNVLIGPALSRNNQFVPGNNSENSLLQGRPLVLIGSDRLHFTPFNPDLHNTLTGLQAELKSVQDAFVGAAWLVRNGQPQAAATFKDLYGFDALRHRAFWGVDYDGKPVIGVTHTMADSVSLGKVLHQLGLKDAVMLDSGASTSLVYQGESLVEYLPRPVPHVVALFPPHAAKSP